MSTSSRTSGDVGASSQFNASGESAYDRISVHPNVGLNERFASTVAGCGLVLYGLNKAGIKGIVSALAGGALLYRGITSWCGMYEALGIIFHERSEHASIGPGEGVHIEKSVVVNRPAREIYNEWRQLENLPRILGHVNSISQVSPTKSHWIITGPFGMKFEWDAEIIQDKPGEMIAWRSLQGADVSSAGSVHFRELGPSETEIAVNLRYSAPAGNVSEAVLRWFDTAPEDQIERDLEDLKAHVESRSAR